MYFTTFQKEASNNFVADIIVIMVLVAPVVNNIVKLLQSTKQARWTQK